MAVFLNFGKIKNMENNLFSIFNKHSGPLNGLSLVLSEKREGTMKLSAQKAERNRRIFFGKLNIDPGNVISAGLDHGNNVEIVTGENKGIVKNTDALLTSEKNLFLSITVADCLPIFIFDPSKKAIGLVHGGWKSLAGKILNSVIVEMKKNFNSNPEKILAGIGPGISDCHFQVKKDLLKKFNSFLKDCLIEREGKSFLDLKKIAKIQLMEKGLQEKNIEINPECTFCLSNKYFSFRRDKSGKEVENVMMATIGIIDKKGKN